LHLGMLIHESFTLISYSNDIKELWNYSYQNRNNALNLLFHVLEIKNMDIEKIKVSANKVNKDRCHSREI
jgi:hypothetical protein